MKSLLIEEIDAIWELYDEMAKRNTDDFYEAIEAFEAFYLDPSEQNRRYLKLALANDRSNRLAAERVKSLVEGLSL